MQFVERVREGEMGGVVHRSIFTFTHAKGQHIRKLVDISPINTPLSHQLASLNTLKYQRNIDTFGHKMILSAQL